MVKKIFLLSLFLTCLIFSVSKFSANKQWDISENKISSIGEASKKLIATVDAPLVIEVYSPNNSILNFCNLLLQRYATHSKHIRIVLHNTLIEHNLSAKFKLTTEHSLVLSYKQNQQAIDVKLPTLSEQLISNLIYKVMDSTQRWVVFLTGHQEADFQDTSALGLSQFSKIFVDHGMHVVSLNLAQIQEVPNNTDLLIVVNPQFELLPIEQTQIVKYLQNGGKMIWFTEPEAPSTAILQNEFGLELAPGIAVDPSSMSLGSPHPALKIITQYPQHSITADITAPTMLPWSGHLQTKNTSKWQIQQFLTTSANSWTYTGPGTEDLHKFASHKGVSGPLQVGVSLLKFHAKAEQRAVVIADSTFITNKYIGLYANKQLATNLISWIQANTFALDFSPAAAQDFSYVPNNLDRFLYRYGFTILFPLLLICIGFFIQRYNTLAERRN